MIPDKLFDLVSSLDNLRTAWIKVKHHALTEEVYYDDYAYAEFEEHLEANLATLHYELVNHIYSPAPLRYFVIPKGDKVRQIYFAAPRDNVVVQAIMNIIGLHFEAVFSANSYGNRLSLSQQESHDIFARWQDQYQKYLASVRGFLNEGPDAWYLITDIANFYPSISLTRLRGLIASEVHDEQTLALIDSFLNLQSVDLNEKRVAVNGLPPGPAYSHFFANIYLNRLYRK